MSHQIKISDKKYSGDLRFFECEKCDYAFIAEIENNTLKDGTIEILNYGDLTVPHSLFMLPGIVLELNVESEVINDKNDR